MKTSRTIKLETYSCSLIFIVTDKMKLECKKLYKKHNLKYDDDGESEGFVFNVDLDKYYLLIDLKYLSHDTIAHEVYHVVMGVTKERHIRDEEARAWLTGYITSQIYKFLNKKKLEVKNG